ncbi:MAG TPA: lipid-A-disaccharide synthase [Thermoanaerobaculia bacterium]|nr:lipid-A-disaccharide synthase [Thermoanaerobaculia bacterium]
MKLCVVAGEASGDLHASGVVRELRKIDPSLELFGIGGARLAAEDVRLVRDARDLAIVGLFNVLRHLPMFFSAFRAIVREIRRERPDAVLLVDYPDFNLRLARTCRRMRIPVVYFISPQIWAWRPRRVRQIAERVDHMLVLFPFERDLYEHHGVPVTYVGHPLVEQLEGIAPRSFDPPAESANVALLPGSRRMEVETLLGPMLDALEVLARERPLAARVLVAPGIARERIESLVRRRRIAVEIVERGRMEALARSDLAICSSGTATLEAAVLGVPSVVVYRLTPLTYALARRLVRLPHFSLVNIVAETRVVPELLQNEVRGERIAAEARSLLEPGRWSEVRHELDRVRRELGEGGTSRRAAAKIATLVGLPGSSSSPGGTA